MSEFWRRMSWMGPAIGAVLMPKCPFCVVAVGSVLNMAGISSAVYRGAFVPAIGMLVALPIVVLAYGRSGAARWYTLAIMASSAIIFILARMDGWPVVFQLISAILYCIGAFLKSTGNCCCVRGKNPSAAQCKSNGKTVWS